MRAEEQGVAEADEPRDPRRWLALAMISVGELMIVLDTTIMNVALPSIQQALGLSDNDRQWVITAYSLAFGGLLLLGGRVADLVGHKRSLMIALTGFALASVVGGFAPNVAVLLASRALQGVFAALLTPSALALLSTTFADPAERGKAFGVYGAIAGGGSGVGLMLGGVLTDTVGWRWCLYVNAPITLVAGLGVMYAVSSRPSRSRSKLDIPGAVLVTAGLVALVYGFAQVPTDGWRAAGTVGSLVAGALLLLLFVLVQHRVQAPLLPLRIVVHRGRSAAFLAVFCVGMGMLGVFFMLTFHLQNVLGYSPVKAGFAMLPLTAGAIFGVQLLSGRLTKVAPRYLISPGLLALASALAMLAFLRVDGDYLTQVLPVLFLSGLGIAWVLVPSQHLATLGAGPDAGVAGAAVMTSQQIGASLGTAAVSTVSSVAAAEFLSSHGRSPDIAVEAIVHGYNIAGLGAAGLLALAAVGVHLLSGRPGEGRREPARIRRPRRTALGVLGGSTVVVLVAGVSMAMVRSGETGCPGEVAISVVAAPEIKPAVEKIATGFTTARPRVPDGRCAVVRVVAGDPAAEAAARSGDLASPTQTVSDAWIPDSSLWLGLLDGVPPKAEASVALSPVVVAAPKPLVTQAMRLGTEVLPGPVPKARADRLPLRILDPVRYAAGMIPLSMVQQSFGEAATDPRGLAVAVRELRKSVIADSAQLFSDRHSLAIAPEQSIWKHNLSNPAIPVTALYPRKGASRLDYPFVVTAQDAVHAAAARAFARHLGTAAAQTTLRQAGFRSPDGTPGSWSARSGVGTQPLPPVSPTLEVAGLLRTWNRLGFGTRALTVFDISAAMADQVPGGVTRARLSADLAREISGLYPDGSELGTWLSAASLDPKLPYRQVGPIRPLSGAAGRRGYLRTLDAVRPLGDDPSSLGRTLLAALRTMTASYTPDRSNVVVVFTGGRSLGGPDDIPLTQLLFQLEAEFDDKRPVEFVFVAVGTDTDPEPLRRIARTVGGALYLIDDPTQIRQVFAKAFARRLCFPACASTN